MKLAVFGAAGRMGRAVTRLAHRDDGIHLVGAIEAADSPLVGRDVGEVAGVGALGVEISADLASGVLGADVVVDFSVAAAFQPVLRQAMHAGVALVSGTTRLGAEDQQLIDRAASSIAVLWAPNMSLGVLVLTRLVERAARWLGDDYDVEVVETHHRGKVDAPSGTARQLFEAIGRVSQPLEPVFGRSGHTGTRATGEIGVHSVRGGGVIGTHTVHWLGALEGLELTHRAIDRDLFAHGALRAARWLWEKPPGRYQLADLIDLEPIADRSEPT